jgi:hypothetical protein
VLNWVIPQDSHVKVHYNQVIKDGKDVMLGTPHVPNVYKLCTCISPTCIKNLLFCQLFVEQTF